MLLSHTICHDDLRFLFEAHIYTLLSLYLVQSRTL